MSTKRKFKSARRPTSTFSHCPVCKTKNLFRMEVDVLCGDCDWTSIESFVESGGMDNIFSAYVNHFDIKHLSFAPEREAQKADSDCEVKPEEFFHQDISA